MKFQFDTRDTKPKLTGLLILSILAAAAVGILALTGLQRHAAAICFVTAGYALGAALILFRKKNRG